VARWHRSSSRAPAHMRRYDPATWGEGPAAIRTWEMGALHWLRADESRSLPFGTYGDEVDVLQESVRLIREWASRHDRSP
jgi:hypothetical protein